MFQLADTWMCRHVSIAKREPCKSSKCILITDITIEQDLKKQK